MEYVCKPSLMQMFTKSSVPCQIVRGATHEAFQAARFVLVPHCAVTRYDCDPAVRRVGEMMSAPRVIVATAGELYI